MDLDVEGDHGPPAQIYVVSTEHMIEPAQKSPIIMSSLDVAVQGYLEEFGEEGAHAFFTSTDGWDRPVLDDRARPRYERHQSLTAFERAFVDHHLGALGVTVLECNGSCASRQGDVERGDAPYRMWSQKWFPGGSRELYAEVMAQAKANAEAILKANSDRVLEVARQVASVLRAPVERGDNLPIPLKL